MTDRVCRTTAFVAQRSTRNINVLRCAVDCGAVCSGRIDKEEMVAALMEHNGLENDIATGIFNAIDYDGNGTIRFSEFVAAGIGDTFTVS